LQGQYDQAIKHLAKALEMNPEYPNTYNKTGIILLAAGRAEEAIEYFNEATSAAKRAVDAANAAGEEKLAAEIGDRIKLYKLGRPYRQN
jgi:tetratricopeptide (TPR) repeat protein